MPAFNKVPEAQRDRLAALTGQRDRLIGGSADTMYIPGRHRETFMSTLALFLETDCFLEIAAPTALHLALPRDEDILYVDHVSVFFPPFLVRVRIDMTFVFKVVDMAATIRHGVCAREMG